MTPLSRGQSFFAHEPLQLLADVQRGEVFLNRLVEEGEHIPASAQGTAHAAETKLLGLFAGETFVADQQLHGPVIRDR